jgi:hypothetical protein
LPADDDRRPSSGSHLARIHRRRVDSMAGATCSSSGRCFWAGLTTTTTEARSARFRGGWRSGVPRPAAGNAPAGDGQGPPHRRTSTGMAGSVAPPGRRQDGPLSHAPAYRRLGVADCQAPLPSPTQQRWDLSLMKCPISPGPYPFR